MAVCLEGPQNGSLAEADTGSSVAAALVRPVLAGLEVLGLDVSLLRARLGAGDRIAPDARLDPERVQAVLDAAAQALGEPALGLRLAEVLPTGSFGFFEYASMAMPTLREGLRQAARFIRLLSERVTLSVEEAGGEAHLVLRQRWNMQRISHLVELALAGLFVRCRDAVGEGMRLRRVNLAGPAPRDAAAYRAFFGAPVVFDAPVDELVFDRALLDAPMRTADRATAAALGTHGRGICPELEAPDPFLDAVRDAARRGLERGDARVSTIASRLGLSVRTMQRRLGELGASYSALVDDVRRETALQLVGRRPATEIALVLGFSTPAAFFRAFKRWTGTTPRAHAAAMRG